MFLERSEFYHEILLAYYMYTCVYVTSIYAIHPLWHTWTRLSYICILYMYVYQCIFIFLLRDHDNDLFYSEFYPFINSLSLALKEMEREAEVYVYIYIATCTNSVSYISLKLYMIRADVYIYDYILI